MSCNEYSKMRLHGYFDYNYLAFVETFIVGHKVFGSVYSLNLRFVLNKMEL